MIDFFRRGLDWKAMIVIGALVAAAIVVPLFASSPDSPLHVSQNTTLLLGKYLCYSLLALSVGLIWGYGGILSLGHGAFFALGGYAMGMYLMRQIGTRGVYGNPILPDFMVFLNWDELPWFWYGFDQFWFAAIMVIFVPGLLAFLFGWFAFRSRVTGVYLSIITQALTFALWQAFLLNNLGFGGNNGFTDFKDILGANIQAPSTRAALFAASAIALAIGYWICRSVVASKYGKVLVATRDAESRTRFLGYRADYYKLFAFVLSACMAGVAGALYVPQVGIINPGEFAPAKSIEVVVWVAVGGRGTLVGPILGGSLVNALKTYFTGGGEEVLWRIALLPLLGLAIFAWLRRTDGWRRTPLIGAAAGAAIAALAFVLPDGIGSWWGFVISVTAAIGWVIAGNNPQVAGVALGALIMGLLREPNAILPLAPYWPFFLGGLFVAVTLFLPRGIVGTISYGWNAWKARHESIKAQEGRDADLTSPEPALPDRSAARNSTDDVAPVALPSLDEADGKRA
jgi:urea transport system permease protein